MLAIALALSAAVGWGLADFFGAVATRRVWVLAVLLVSQGVGLLAVAVVVLARAEPLPERSPLLFGLLAGLALALALGALYQGMSVGMVAVVAPVASTGAAVPLLVGTARGEELNGAGIVGCVLMLAGVGLVSRPRQEGAPTSVVAGVGFGLVAALASGVFFLTVGEAAEGGVVWATFMQRVGVVSTVTATLLVLRRPWPGVGRQLPRLLAMGALDLGATFAFAAATTEGLIGVVSVLASLYPAVTIGLAFLLLGERLAPWQWGGLLAVFGGIGLISGQ